MVEPINQVIELDVSTDEANDDTPQILEPQDVSNFNNIFSSNQSNVKD